METNYEHYKKEIDELFEKKSRIGFNVVTNRVCECDDIDTCSKCEFDKNGGYGCVNKFAMWLVSEYKDSAENVDWSKVPVDTQVLCSDDLTETWFKGYFAKYENGVIYVFNGGRTSWSADYPDEECYSQWSYAKLVNPEDCKSAFHPEEKELTKEERMEQLSAIYKDSCVKSAWKEMIEAVDEFWQSDIDDEKKDKIANMVMMLLKMEE